jgi:hypothetical protein
MIIGVTMMIVAAFLMANGHILGEDATSLSRILLIVAIPVIATSRKSESATVAQREKI